MLFPLKTLAIVLATPVFFGIVSEPASSSEPVCSCNTTLTLKEKVMFDTRNGQPFTGACKSEYKAEWTSILKKKKMSGELQAIVNGRKAILHYSEGRLRKTEEKFASGKNAALYHFAEDKEGNQVFNGQAIQWHESGATKYSGKFEMGTPVGDHQWFDSRGSRIEIRKVVAVQVTNVTVQVEQTQWHDYQTKKSITRFTASWDGKTLMTDKKMASFFSFHPNGKKKEITVYDSVSSGIIRQEFYDEKGNRVQGKTPHQFN